MGTATQDPKCGHRQLISESSLGNSEIMAGSVWEPGGQDSMLEYTVFLPL